MFASKVRPAFFESTTKIKIHLGPQSPWYTSNRNDKWNRREKKSTLNCRSANDDDDVFVPATNGARFGFTFECVSGDSSRRANLIKIREMLIILWVDLRVSRRHYFGWGDALSYYASPNKQIVAFIAPGMAARQCQQMANAHSNLFLIGAALRFRNWTNYQGTWETWMGLLQYTMRTAMGSFGNEMHARRQFVLVIFVVQIWNRLVQMHTWQWPFPLLPLFAWI